MTETYVIADYGRKQLSGKWLITNLPRRQLPTAQTDRRDNSPPNSAFILVNVVTACCLKLEIDQTLYKMFFNQLYSLIIFAQII